MEDGYPAKVAAFMAENPPPPYLVWSCNWQAFSLFEFLSTQWRSEMGRLPSLIYSEVYRRMDELGIRKRKRRLALMRDVRLMESAVREEAAKRAEKK